jgi:hypothetical protein
MSRHLSDLERLMDTDHATLALANLDLYNEIIAHRAAFYRRGHINYTTHAPATINFIPPAGLAAAWQGDYDQMRETMFYGDQVLTYAALMERLGILLGRFRQAAQ